MPRNERTNERTKETKEGMNEENERMKEEMIGSRFWTTNNFSESDTHFKLPDTFTPSTDLAEFTLSKFLKLQPRARVLF